MIVLTKYLYSVVFAILVIQSCPTSLTYIYIYMCVYIFFLISFLRFIISRLYTHVRFRRACRSVLMWSLQYARRPKCGSSYVRHTLVWCWWLYRRRTYRIAHGETTRLGYNASVPATMAPTGRATGRWPYQMLNGRTQCHVHIPIHARSAERARLLVHRARTHIVTSVAKRLTASANFTRIPQIGS